jgi:hypothetical protein
MEGSTLTVTRFCRPACLQICLGTPLFHHELSAAFLHDFHFEGQLNNALVDGLLGCACWLIRP